MLNLGIIGNIENFESVVTEFQNNQIINIIGKSSLGTNTNLHSYHFSIPEYNKIELIERSDVLLIDEMYQNSFTVLNSLIRKSKHLFINNLPGLSIDEITQLFKLSNEAGVTIQFRNPLYFLKPTQWLNKNLALPAYLDVSLIKPYSLEYQKDLFQVLMMLRGTTGLSPKKIDAVSFGSEDRKELFINVRLEFSDASVVNLNYGNREGMPEGLKILTHASDQNNAFDYANDIYLSNNQPIDLTDFEFKSETHYFIDAILHKSKVICSLEELLIVHHALQKINRKLAWFNF